MLMFVLHLLLHALVYLQISFSLSVMTHGHKELEDGHVELEAAAESDSG